MGRYDKIRVYNGSSWVQPSEIKVYNGANWVSLGANTSDNTKSLHVFKAGQSTPTRATLNKQVTTNYYYHTGQTELDHDAAGNNWCFNPIDEDFDCTVDVEIRKNSNTDKIVYRGYDTANITWIQVTWLADGRIAVYTKNGGSGGGDATYYSSNSVGANTWVRLTIIWHKTYDSSTGNYYTKQTINFNGVATVQNGVMESAGINRRAYLGSSGLDFRNYFNILMSTNHSATGSSFYGYVQNGSMGSTTADTTVSWV